MIKYKFIGDREYKKFKDRCDELFDDGWIISSGQPLVSPAAITYHVALEKEVKVGDAVESKTTF